MKTNSSPITLDIASLSDYRRSIIASERRRAFISSAAVFLLIGIPAATLLWTGIGFALNVVRIMSH